MNFVPPTCGPEDELRGLLPVEGWRVAIEEIAARHGLSMAAAFPFASGSDVVWSVGDAVVKLTGPRWTWQLDAEVHWLRQVAGRLSVATPEVLARDELAGWPYVAMSRVPGRALGDVWPELEQGERMRLAADLGELTRSLHELEVEGDADAWDAFWETCCSGVAERHAGADLPAELVAAIPEFLARHDLAMQPRVLLHTELLDQHVFVAERDGHLAPSALIDFADARIGPVEYEFAAPVEFIFRGGPGQLRAYLRAYGTRDDDLGPARSERMLAWALTHRYGSLERMLSTVAPKVPRSLEELAGHLYST